MNKEFFAKTKPADAWFHTELKTERSEELAVRTPFGQGKAMKTNADQMVMPVARTYILVLEHCRLIE